MTLQIYNGRKESKKILNLLKDIIDSKNIHPKLAIFLFGNDPASLQYVNIKSKRGEEIGITVDIIKSEKADLKSFKKKITEIKDFYDGIMVQLPIHGKKSPTGFLDFIPPEKDVDGIATSNLELINTGKSIFYPAVSEAVTHIVKSVNVKGKSILVLGNSKYVGQPVYDQLQSTYNDIDLSIVNKDSNNIREKMSGADIVISCIGKAEIYSSKLLKTGSILIDVGTSKNKKGKIVGDFKLANNLSNIRMLTPVPGGVGPLTVSFLLKNVLKAAIK